MAVTVNQPGNPNPPETNTDPVSNPAGVPTSQPGGTKYVLPTETRNGSDVKVNGSANNDSVTSKDLLRDTDHVIGTGKGDDVFYFFQSDNTNSKLRGAVVDLGAGDKDQVVLANQLSDYTVTFFDNNKIVVFEYTGDGGHNNAKITFSGAEIFTFRNIDDHTGQANAAQTFTVDGLRAAYGLEV